MNEMTVLSREMYGKAIRPKSIKEAVDVLNEYGKYRSLADVLRTFSGSDKPNKELEEGLLLWDPESKPDANARKLRNWMSGQVRSIRKEDAFAVSRALHLDLEKTDEFLRMAAGEGIHWREPKEMVWAYAAAHDYGREKVNSMLQRLAAMGELPRASLSPEVDSYTEEIAYLLAPVLYGTEDDLFNFINQHWDKLGSSHNMAFMVFTQLTELLERGYLALEEESSAGDKNKKLPKEISTREMLETFMHRRLIPVVKRGEDKSAQFSAVQRSIRENWPDEVTISKMKKRQLEVTRKTLILLFLATDGCGSDYEDLMHEEENLNPDELFENMYMRMELMLRSCGFQGLDPRSPFDWLALSCMSAGDSWLIDEKMGSILEKMFP